MIDLTPDQVLILLPIVRTILTVVILFIMFQYIKRIIKRLLLKHAITKKQRSNIEIFSQISTYVFIGVVAIFAIFTYVGDWSSLGVTFGFMSAAIGFALQRPISGIAAWLMLIIKRPFEIGDRIIVAGVKGDVTDITLSHIHLREIGGVITSEEHSGRIVLVPNSVFFEQNIINYTHRNDYVLDQVVFTVTFESDVEKACKIAVEATTKHVLEFLKETKDPYTRTFFRDYGIIIHVRYFTPAQRMQEFSSRITYEIYKKIQKAKDVSLAYPHTEVILSKK